MQEPLREEAARGTPASGQQKLVYEKIKQGKIRAATDMSILTYLPAETKLQNTGICLLVGKLEKSVSYDSCRLD